VGYGKYFSRFLHLLPEVVTETLKEHNQSLSAHRIAEICGDAHFNANLHPPLLDWEISYPTGESGPTENRIVTADLAVRRDQHDQHRLALWEVSSGRRIVPVDLGFLNPRMRPPLFQLLSRFTPACNISIRIPDSVERQFQITSTGSTVRPTKAEPSIEKVIYRPRVILDEGIVIARRRWQIPSAFCPRKVTSMRQSEYFLQLQKWRRILKIPDEVFVRVQPVPAFNHTAMEKQAAQIEDAEKQPAEKIPAPGGAIVQPKRTKLASKDLYKPQYIDFCNPLLVELFQHLPSSMERYNLLIEERLPSSNQLFQIGEERYSTEFVLQLNVSEQVQQELSVSEGRAC
jgi:hypothetical protein